MRDTGQVTDRFLVADRSRSWKPISLRGPVLGGFVLTSVLIIITLEILSNISSRTENGGGLSFAESVNEISMMATFW